MVQIKSRLNAFQRILLFPDIEHLPTRHIIQLAVLRSTKTGWCNNGSNAVVRTDVIAWWGRERGIKKTGGQGGTERIRRRGGSKTREKIKTSVVLGQGKGVQGELPLLHFQGWKAQDNGAPSEGWHDREPRDIAIVSNAGSGNETESRLNKGHRLTEKYCDSRTTPRLVPFSFIYWSGLILCCYCPTTRVTVIGLRIANSSGRCLKFNDEWNRVGWPGFCKPLDL